MEPTEQQPVKKERSKHLNVRTFRFRDDQAAFVAEQEKIHGSHTDTMRAIIDLAMQGGKQTTDQEAVKDYKILLKAVDQLKAENKKLLHQVANMQTVIDGYREKSSDKTNTPNPPAPVEKKKNWIDEIW